MCFHFFNNDFHHCFFRVFSFLIAFVHVTNFLYHDCVFAAFLSGTLFLCCCKASATDLREHFYALSIFTFHSFPTFATLPGILRISECFFTLFENFYNFCLALLPDSFRTSFDQGFLGSRQFFIEGCKASHKSWKIRPVLSVCLNHTVFRKINYSVDSIHVLSPYGTLYQPLQGFELTIY